MIRIGLYSPLLLIIFKGVHTYNFIYKWEFWKTHPMLKLVNSYLIDSPQPSNLSYLWNFGSLLAVCLIMTNYYWCNIRNALYTQRTRSVWFCRTYNERCKQWMINSLPTLEHSFSFLLFSLFTYRKRFILWVV